MRFLPFIFLLCACAPQPYGQPNALQNFSAALLQANQPSPYPKNVLADAVLINNGYQPNNYAPVAQPPMNCVAHKTGIWTNVQCY